MPLRTLFVSAFLLLATAASSQNHYGLRAGYNNYFSTGLSSTELGLQWEVERNEQQGLRMSVDFGFGKLKNASYTAFAEQTTTLPSSISVLGTTNLRSYLLAGDYYRYVGKGSLQEGGLYLFLGIGFTVVSTKTTYDFGPYSKAEYSVTGNANEEDGEYFYQSTLRGGLGYSFAIEPLTLFVELRAAVPVNNLEEVLAPVKFGPNGGLWVGARL